MDASLGWRLGLTTIVHFSAQLERAYSSIKLIWERAAQSWEEEVESVYGITGRATRIHVQTFRERVVRPWKAEHPSLAHARLHSDHPMMRDVRGLIDRCPALRVLDLTAGSVDITEKMALHGVAVSFSGWKMEAGIYPL
jgi:hypothetical protein